MFDKELTHLNFKNMEIKDAILDVEKILDDWDPIGILDDFKPIVYTYGYKGEYTNYVEPVIKTFLAGKSVYEYLIMLHSDLIDEPDESDKREIKLVETRIINL